MGILVEVCSRRIVGRQRIKKIKTILRIVNNNNKVVVQIIIIKLFQCFRRINRIINIINKDQNPENSLNRVAINNPYKTIIKRNQLKIIAFIIIIQAYHLKTSSLTVFIAIVSPKSQNLILQTKTYQEITPQLLLSNPKDKEQFHSPQKMIKKISARTLPT